MSTLLKLIEHFSQFPGIGPRQARRFVYFLLTRDEYFIDNLIRELKELKRSVTLCTSCQRFFSKSSAEQSMCDLCIDKNRDDSLLLVVEKDIDLENIERTKVYNGRYFVLGGRVPILEKDPSRIIRAKKLTSLVEERATRGLKEIVLALSINPEGENTSNYLRELLSPLAEKYSCKVLALGRGLSTGSELEYSDTETIKNAFEGRHE